MKVLMTGASGFIGSNVLQYLLNNTDWTFTIICSWRHKGNPLFVPKSNRVEVITHDLTAPIPDIGDFDYILNLASESHVDRSQKDPVGFIENNISSALQVLEYARQHPPKLFLHFSTDEVYGANDHEEWDVLLPTNPYAASKAAQEVICIAYYNTYHLPIIITNSNNVIGEHQDPEKFVPKVAALIKTGKTVDIHMVNGKPGRRYWNPVDNVASALLFILKLKYKGYGVKPPRYALGGGEELDNLEMAKLVAETLGKPLKYKSIDAKSVRPGYDSFYPETEGTLRHLGWEPPYGLREGLAWIRSL